MESSIPKVSTHVPYSSMRLVESFLHMLRKAVLCSPEQHALFSRSHVVPRSGSKTCMAFFAGNLEPR
jgi:hypothetical protein